MGNGFSPLKDQQVLSILSNSVTFLDLSGKLKSLEHVEFLAEALDQNTSIRCLDLSNNRLTSKEINVLCDTIHNHPSLMNLDLSNNELGDVGAILLSNLIHDMCRAPAESTQYGIRFLNLSNNRIGDLGGQAIADVVRTKESTLRSLDMGSNLLGNYGCSVLSTALEKNPNVLYLNIKGNTYYAKTFDILNAKLQKNASSRAFGGTKTFPSTPHGLAYSSPLPPETELNPAQLFALLRSNTSSNVNVIDLVQRFLRKFENVNVVDREGRTILHWAAELGDAKVVDLLLQDSRISAETVSNDGATPFSIACAAGNLAVVRLFIERRNFWRFVNHSLLKSARHHRVEVVEYLCQCGAFLMSKIPLRSSRFVFTPEMRQAMERGNAKRIVAVREALSKCVDWSVSIMEASPLITDIILQFDTPSAELWMVSRFAPDIPSATFSISSSSVTSTPSKLSSKTLDGGLGSVTTTTITTTITTTTTTLPSIDSDSSFYWPTTEKSLHSLSGSTSDLTACESPAGIHSMKDPALAE